MIRIHVPGFYDSDSGKPRWGDAQIISDGTYFDVIDGYCGVGASRLVSILRTRGIKSPYLHISHAHYDHYDGIRKIIRNSWFKPKALYMYNPDVLGDVCSSVKSEKATMKAIAKEAKAKGIPVIYVDNGSTIEHGDIKIKVYRSKPSYSGNSDAYINNGSLCYWFPSIKYLTTGDAGLECAKEHGLHPSIIKIGHHGNDCIRVMARYLRNNGCIYCWDNDYTTYLTDFLMTGREDCLAVGMRYFNVHGDINIISCNGKGHVYKDGNVYSYNCDYKGKNPLKGANVDIVTKVLQGKAGSGNARMSYCLNHYYNPLSVQGKVNDVVKTAKGILDGTLKWGNNEARYARINKELGNGYAPIVQKEINVLCGVDKW